MNHTQQTRFILAAAASHLVEAYRKTIADYQSVFESINGHFPEDQKPFALEALNNFFKGE